MPVTSHKSLLLPLLSLLLLLTTHLATAQILLVRYPPHPPSPAPQFSQPTSKTPSFFQTIEKGCVNVIQSGQTLPTCADGDYGQGKNGIRSVSTSFVIQAGFDAENHKDKTAFYNYRFSYAGFDKQAVSWSSEQRLCLLDENGTFFCANTISVPKCSSWYQKKE